MWIISHKGVAEKLEVNVPAKIKPTNSAQDTPSPGVWRNIFKNNAPRKKYTNCTQYS